MKIVVVRKSRAHNGRDGSTPSSSKEYCHINKKK